MLDMTESIAPRSDQLNADDLMSGPRTFTIAEVKRGNTEQPIDVHLVEFPGRPFKPSKSMRRVMVAAWGPDASTYGGKRMTLYRDPTVRFGGQEVGGIRISHLDGIDKPLNLALTVTRGKRAPYVVQPLPKEQTTKLPSDPVGKMIAAFAAQGVDLDRLEAKVGKPRSQWGSDDVTEARTWYHAITKGGADVDELFPDPDVTAPEETTLPEGWTEDEQTEWEPPGGLEAEAVTAVIGVDLSLTATGIATPTGVFEIPSKGRKADTLLQRSARLHDIASDVWMECERHARHGDGQPSVLVVIEAPAFSRTTGHMHDRSGLWWLVVDELCAQPWATVAEVSPTARAKYATGKGTAGKEAVLLAVDRRYPDVKVVSNNEADAVVLRAMGCDHLGSPLASVPATHRAALDAVAWPLDVTS